MDDDAPQDDGFKWFGEGFGGFPKRLPEDCVEYAIFVIKETLTDVAAIRAELNRILKTARDICQRYTKNYIWQRDSFELKIRPPLTELHSANPRETSSNIPHLKGRTNFGDSVADEWLIVYILLALSKQFPDAWIQVYDTDGEFLLIEAANALPKWLNPDIAQHRVWLNNGHLRIIPLDSEVDKRNLSMQDALTFIRRRPQDLIISPFIEEEAFYRLRDYPAAISTSLHHALVTIPRRLAYVLHENPAAISPAVEAFYLRDPISLKPLATKDTATLQFPPEDFVTVSVRFTKVGYAQVRSQIFDAPPAWTSVIPRLEDVKADVGMKVACGFEMLVTDPQNADKNIVREIKILLEDVDSGEVALPSDEEIAKWERRQDDEKWLDIDYRDFEDELAGKNRRRKAEGAGFGDQGVQENLRKMVSRFEDFLNDDTAGADGIDEDDVDMDDGDSEGTEGGEDKAAGFDEAEFERAMKEMMGMPAAEVERSGLLAEARRLALEDEEEGEAPDDDEEVKKVMDLMEKELKRHGALDLDKRKAKAARHTHEKSGPVFGPEKPPHMRNPHSEDRAVVKKDTGTDEDDEEVGPGDEELSSDDEELNDVDLGLAKNMLEAFKGQAGLSGPAGNMMRALGINMPRDEGSDEDN